MSLGNSFWCFRLAIFSNLQASWPQNGPSHNITFCLQLTGSPAVICCLFNPCFSFPFSPQKEAQLYSLWSLKWNFVVIWVTTNDFSSPRQYLLFPLRLKEAPRIHLLATVLFEMDMEWLLQQMQIITHNHLLWPGCEQQQRFLHLFWKSFSPYRRQ